MHRPLLARLVCPACQGGLSWDAGELIADEVLTADARCDECEAHYAIHDGVAIMAPPGAADIWRDSARGLADALAADAATERALMAAPLTELNGADLVFRGMVHDARGELAAAAQAFASADPLLYGAEQRACRDRLLSACVDRTVGAAWVLDVASGRGTLVEALARAGIPTVASDLSAVAMLRLRRRLSDAGLLDRVDCVVADAGALPFADRAVPAATTYVGLQNIPDPLPSLRELQRACEATRIVGYGYPADDSANRDALASLGFSASADLGSLRAAAEGVGLSSVVVDGCRSPASPTPRGEVIAGGAVDGLPVAPTTLDWYLLEAT